MKDTRTIVIGSVTGFLIVMALHSCAHAEPARSTRDLERSGIDMTPAVVLARVCAKEAGFAGTADCAPIARVLLRVGRGNVVRGARWYSPRAFDPARLRQKPWLAYLRGDGREPRNWPRTLSWARHREQWLRLVDYARDVLSGAVDAPCDVDHWGAPNGPDLRRALANGWRRVDCGAGTLNAFWRVPRRAR